VIAQLHLQNGIRESGCSEAQQMQGVAGHGQVGSQEMEQAVVRWLGMRGQETRWQGKGEDRPGDHWQKRLQLAGGGCWFVLLERGGCGLFGSIHWDRVAHGGCMALQGGDL
jgi:hypothetical protein